MWFPLQLDTIVICVSSSHWCSSSSSLCFFVVVCFPPFFSFFLSHVFVPPAMPLLSRAVVRTYIHTHTYTSPIAILLYLSHFPPSSLMYIVYSTCIGKLTDLLLLLLFINLQPYRALFRKSSTAFPIFFISSPARRPTCS